MQISKKLLAPNQKETSFTNSSLQYKEARETHDWIRLLQDSEIIEDDMSSSLLLDIEEILRIVGSIQVTFKRRPNS